MNSLICLGSGKISARIALVVQTFTQVIKTHRFSLIVLCLILLLRFGPTLFGKVLFFGDDFSLLVPQEMYVAEWLRKGILPLWNPNVLGGLAIYGDISQTIIHPNTFLFILLHPATALTVNQIIHTVLGFLGMYTLALFWGRKTLGATLASTLWILSMSVTGAYNNLVILQSMVWMPWVVFFLVRLALKQQFKHTLGVAITTALLCYAGYPQLLVYAVGAGLTLGLWKSFTKGETDFNRWKAFFLHLCLAGLIFLGLTAVILIPFLEVLRESTRVAQSVKQSTAGSVLPSELLKVFIPSLFDNFSQGLRWGPLQSATSNPVFYVGLTPLFLFCWKLSKKRESEDLFFFFLIVGTIAFSLGDALPGYQIVQQLLPIFRFSRGPGIVYTVTSLFLGLWVSGLLDRKLLPAELILKRLLVAALLVTIFFGLLWQISLQNFSGAWMYADQILSGRLTSSPYHTVELDREILRIVGGTFLWVLIFFSASLYCLWKKNYPFFVIILAFDLWLASSMLYRYAPASVYDFKPDQRMVDVLQDPQKRMITRNYNAPYADFGTYYSSLAVRKPFSDSYVDEAELESFSGAVRMKETLTPDWSIPANVRSLHGYVTLLPLFTDRYWSDHEEPRINNLRFIPLDDPRLREWSVGYYLVDDWFPTYDETFSQLRIAQGQTSQNSTWSIYQLNALPRFRYEDGSAVELKQLYEDPNTISFTTTVPSEKSSLIIADRWNRWWEAEINGTRVSVDETVSGLRKISVAPGEQHIVMKFVPQTLFVGLGITVATVLGLLFLSFVRNIKRTAHKPKNMKESPKRKY